ncbi:hypothetical protein JCM6882_005391 [Rhodosporidiobolus microsporus]
MGPSVFKRDFKNDFKPRLWRDPNALPQVPSSANFDKHLAKWSGRQDVWGPEQEEAVPGVRDGFVKNSRRQHSRARDELLNRHDNEYVQAHRNDHRTHHQGEDAHAHAEDVRWHDLVLPRLRAYGLGVVPNAHESEAAFRRDEEIALGRMDRLRKELAYEEGEIRRATRRGNVRLHLPPAAVQILSKWNSEITAREKSLRDLPNTANSLHDVEEQLHLEEEIDYLLVAEDDFIHFLGSSHEHDEHSIATARQNALRAADELKANKGPRHPHERNESQLHAKVEEQRLRRWSPARSSGAPQYQPNAHYWCLVFTKALMLTRAEEEHSLENARDRAEKAKLQENIHEAHEMFNEIEREVGIMSPERKKKDFRAIDKAFRGRVTGVDHDIATGRAFVRGTYPRDELAPPPPVHGRRPSSSAFNNFIPIQHTDGHIVHGPGHDLDNAGGFGNDDDFHSDSGSDSDSGGVGLPPLHRHPFTAGGPPFPVPERTSSRAHGRNGGEEHPNVAGFSFPAPPVPPPHRQLPEPPRARPNGPRGMHLANPINSLRDPRVGQAL